MVKFLYVGPVVMTEKNRQVGRVVTTEKIGQNLDTRLPIFFSREIRTR